MSMKSSLLKGQQAADLLGVKLCTLSRMRFEKRGPKWVQVGRLVRYREDHLEEYISQQTKGIAPNPTK